jgi:hypothetical protein
MTHVMVGYLHTDAVSHSFMDSLWRVKEEQGDGYGYDELTRFAIRCGPMSIPQGRNQLVATFLKETDAEWLWMVDTDMGFYPTCLANLIHAATESDIKVLGAHCIGEFGGISDGMGGYIRSHKPTLYDENLEIMVGFPEGELVRVAATGAACLLIHRSAVEGWDRWFDPMPRLGEDLSFCMRLNHRSIPIYVHTGIKTSHHKSAYLK